MAQQLGQVHISSVKITQFCTNKNKGLFEFKKPCHNYGTFSVSNISMKSGNKNVYSELLSGQIKLAKLKSF